MTPVRITRGLTVSVLGAAMALAGVSCGKGPTTPSPTTASPTTASPTTASPATPSPTTQVPVPAGPTVPYRIEAKTEAPDWSVIVGARVEVLDGPQAGTFCETDQTGRCTLPAMFSGAPTPEIRMTKDGFFQESVRFPASDIRGNLVTMYFRLTPTAAPAMIAGIYTMTITASSTCTDLPSNGRTWTNAATISQDRQNPAAWGAVDVTPRGQFPGQFYGGVLGNSVGFRTDPDSQFPYDAQVVLAPLDSGRFLVANGTLQGRLSGSTIETILKGDLAVAEGPSSGSGSYLYHPVATCQATDHRLTFVRQ